MWMILAALLAGTTDAEGSAMERSAADAHRSEYHQEVDWFQHQTHSVHARWLDALQLLAPAEVERARGAQARVDVRVDDAGRVVAASLGRSTGSTTVDHSLLHSLDDVTLMPPPDSLSGSDGLVRFSVYLDVTGVVTDPNADA